MVGAGGFVGKAVTDRLSAMGGNVLAITREDVDLDRDDAAQRLTERFRPDDCVIVVAAKAPCKTPDMLASNIAMMARVLDALRRRPVDHVIYVSSDAIFADTDSLLTEQSLKAPESLHGIMHLARELMLKNQVGSRELAILRPTLIYGAADPHSGYGPNQYRRLAAAGRDIVLFGEGEEQRDHVLIDDVAEIVGRVVRRRSIGSLNIASGAVHTFRAIAEYVARLHAGRIKVIGSPRQGPMPHRGYRPFDISAIGAAFPDMKMTQLYDGLVIAHEAVARQGNAAARSA